MAALGCRQVAVVAAVEVVVVMGAVVMEIPNQGARLAVDRRGSLVEVRQERLGGADHPILVAAATEADPTTGAKPRRRCRVCVSSSRPEGTRSPSLTSSWRLCPSWPRPVLQ